MSAARGLEQELRDTLDRVAGRAPVPDGLAERLVERSTRGGTTRGRALRWRRPGPWLPVVAGAAAVILVAVGVLAARGSLFAATSGQPRPDVVPWSVTDQEAVSAEATSPRPVGAAPGTRVCTDTDLSLVSSRSSVGDQGDGWMVTELVLQSTASADCSVSAYGIDVALVDAAGRLIDDDAPRIGGGVRMPGEFRVQPGQLVSATMWWAHVAGPGVKPDRIVILPRSDLSAHPVSTLSISLTGVTAPAHPHDPSNVGPWRTGWLFADVESISDSGAVGSLTVTVHAPATAAAHSVVPFTVDVQNRTDHSVSLRPCPTVQVTATVVPLKQWFTAGTRGPLNCAAAPRSVPAGGTVRFAAQVDTAGVPAGRGRVTWAFVSNGDSAQSLVSAWAPVTFGP